MENDMSRRGEVATENSNHQGSGAGLPPLPQRVAKFLREAYLQRHLTINLPKTSHQHRRSPSSRPRFLLFIKISFHGLLLSTLHEDLMEGIVVDEKLEKLRPTYCPGLRPNSVWTPLTRPDDHYLEETPSDTTTIDYDSGPTGLQEDSSC
ncbi:uncharacterized protein LOC114212095 isoform X2 [Eumetopias jubatus]|uniref:uncharacterized protein LOC114212095 isoform X2 n=1 Tax=Eumetopias jubatus TaxID=34886 RepID=UPI00101702DB|nr:uncharacterized protein LOC114212095 isoform X2 [Eumetopias jubatus]